MIYLKKFNEKLYKWHNKRMSSDPFQLRFDLVGNDFIMGEYTINNDGSIDVDGSVDFYDQLLSILPVKFNKVSGNFDCFNNDLPSLIDCPNEVGGYFYCSHNNLTSLEYCPRYIGGDFSCHSNYIWDFKGIGEIKYDIEIGQNPVSEIFNLCRTMEFIKYVNEFTPIRGKTILGKRLQECLYMCDVDIDVTTLSFKNYTLLE